MMDLQTLLGTLPQATFLSEYYHRLPFAQSADEKLLSALVTWDSLTAMLAADDADVLVVRDGGRHEGPLPRTHAEAEALRAAGCTILLRHAERHNELLAQLAESFRADLLGEVDVHVYATPPGEFGFSWHYDAEDVFILQTAGSKQYSLRKNTVQPWPLVESLPRDMHYEREQSMLLRATLKAGDWLYIPCGYWHKAEALAEDDPVEVSISVALGVLAPAAIEIYDFLRDRLLRSLVWRQRLPIAGELPSDLADLTLESIYRTIFDQLAVDLTATLRGDETLEAFLRQRFGQD